MANFKGDDNPGALFIPAGILTGMGVGFLQEELIGWMFAGLGVGFIFFAVTSIYYQNK